MEAAFRCLVFPALLLLFAGATSGSCQPVDVIKMIGYFPNMTAIYASPPAEGQSEPRCLHGMLTQYQPDGGNITYVWTMTDSNGTESSITHHISKGPSLDEAIVVSSSDPDNSFIASVPYTDYKTCYILKTGDLGGQCLLWVNDEFKDDFPKTCTKKYHQICGESVDIYNGQDCIATT